VEAAEVESAGLRAELAEKARALEWLAPEL
jgi:hypothetical protein